MMTDAEQSLDKHREMLLTMALNMASKVLVQVDEGGLEWAGISEAHSVEEAKLQIRVEYDVNAPYVQIYIDPKGRDIQTVDMGPFVMMMINAGGLSMQVPRSWIERLIQAGATL